MTKTPLYRPCVGIMLVNDANLVFVGQRIDTTAEAWQMPQGGIDEGETPQQAMFREMEEEIGTRRASVMAESADWLTYDLPDNLKGKLWKGKYHGQTQKWFLARFTGQDSDINLQTAHPEFHQWQWVKPEQLPDLIVPFKQELYRKILQEFLPLIR